MKIKTLIPVTYNNGITGQETGLVTGILLGCNQQLRFGFESNYMYEYVNEDNQIISTNAYPVSETYTNELYELVKDQVPTGLSYVDTTTYLYYLGFKIQMAATFNISVNDIEIIL